MSPYSARSQPTYEELKLYWRKIAKAEAPGSQPTYEELKPSYYNYIPAIS